MRWHRVEEEFPKNNGKFLVKRSWSSELIAIGECYFLDSKFDDSLDEVCGKITHWAYLPKEPKEHYNLAVKDCDCEGCQIIRTWK